MEEIYKKKKFTSKLEEMYVIQSSLIVVLFSPAEINNSVCTIPHINLPRAWNPPQFVPVLGFKLFFNTALVVPDATLIPIQLISHGGN